MNWSVDAGRSQDMVDVLCTLWFYWFDSDATVAVGEWAQAATRGLDSPKADWLFGFTSLLSGGDVGASLAMMTKALDAFDSAGDEEWAARTSMFIGTFTKDPDEGMALAQRAVAYFSQFDYGVDMEMARFNESAFHVVAGDIDTAIEIRREILDWAESHNYERMISWAHWQLALTLVAADDPAARDHNLIHLDNMAIDGFLEGFACAADIEAVIRIRRGDSETGLRVLGGALAVYESLQNPVRFPEAEVLVGQALMAVNAALGEPRVAELLEQGRRLSVDELRELAHS